MGGGIPQRIKIPELEYIMYTYMKWNKYMDMRAHYILNFTKHMIEYLTSEK